MSDKREKFRRLATKRVNNALKQLHLISNLSNMNNYEFTEQEVKQIFNALDEELRSCKSSFQKNLKKKNKMPIDLFEADL